MFLVRSTLSFCIRFFVRTKFSLFLGVCLCLPACVCVFHFRFRFRFRLHWVFATLALLVFCLFLPHFSTSTCPHTRTLCICCRSPVAPSRRTVYHKMGQRTGNFQLECTMLLNDNLRHIGWNFPVSAQTECIYCIELKWVWVWVWVWVSVCVCDVDINSLFACQTEFLPFDDAFHYFWIEFIAYTQYRPMISCCWCYLLSLFLLLLLLQFF